MTIPPAIHGQKYVSLGTYRKSGELVRTPVWFGEEGDKLYVMSNGGSGKAKRIRNNQNARIAPCTIRGKISGPDFTAKVRVLPQGEFQRARQTIDRKYWAARLPWIWRNTSLYLEISFA